MQYRKQEEEHSNQDKDNRMLVRWNDKNQMIILVLANMIRNMNYVQILYMYYTIYG